MFIAFHLAKAEKVFSRDLVRELNLQEDRPWIELRRGWVLTEHWLARQLRPYGLRPRTVWIGERSSKGYVLEEMLDAFRRYVPRSEIDDLPGQTRPVAEEVKEEEEESAVNLLQHSMTAILEAVSLQRQQDPGNMKYTTPPLLFAALAPRRHHAPGDFTKDTAQAQAALYRKPLDTTTPQPILRC